MDVEAQDDGVMAKIFQGDGSKAIKVGTRIAVLADAGDDVSSLEIPSDDSKPIETATDNVKGGEDASYESSGVEKEIKGTPQNKRHAKDKPATSPMGPGQNPKYPLYPAVIALIHENHISDEDQKKIPASGPNGRLLKGDVLSYLGSIDADYSSQQSKRIEHLAHLDLSNIKVLRPTPKADSPTESAAAVDAATPPSPAPRQVTTVSLTISLSEVLKVQKRIRDTLGVTMPLSTFLSRAVDFANDDLPAPKSAKPGSSFSSSSDDLFNAVLGLNSIPRLSRGTYLPQIDALPSPVATRSPPPPSRLKRPDIIDILSGKASGRPPNTPALRSVTATATSSSPSPSVTTGAGAANTFTVTVPPNEEKRARTFLERMKTVLQVEPGRLVL